MENCQCPSKITTTGPLPATPVQGFDHPAERSAREVVPIKTEARTVGIGGRLGCRSVHMSRYVALACTHHIRSWKPLCVPLTKWTPLTVCTSTCLSVRRGICDSSAWNRCPLFIDLVVMRTIIMDGRLRHRLWIYHRERSNRTLIFHKLCTAPLAIGAVAEFPCQADGFVPS